MILERESPCKINLLLNILGKRADGFHELETVMLPLKMSDSIRIERTDADGVHLTCSDPSLPTNSENLVVRATERFLQSTGITEGIRIHLEKRVPIAAGLGGGSSNAANTLLGLNELFGKPLSRATLDTLAAGIGSDVPFFLQSLPALATGRGEQIEPVQPFPALKGLELLLIHPGFGVSTVWAYRRLSQFPEALNGVPGRGRQLINCLRNGDIQESASLFYNSLETPVLRKYPILAEYQACLRNHGASMALMSGSGSSTFALFSSKDSAAAAEREFRKTFGTAAWIVSVSV